MTAPGKSFYPVPILPPNPRLQTTRDPQSQPTASFHQMLQQLWARLNGKNLFVPCVASVITTNQILLTPMLTSQVPDQPGTVANYEDYATYAFTSPLTSSGGVVLRVQTLPLLPCFKSNGAAPIGLNDMTLDLQYFATFVDIYNSGNGGWVIR